jgi:hypothetical protein
VGRGFPPPGIRKAGRAVKLFKMGKRAAKGVAARYRREKSAQAAVEINR